MSEKSLESREEEVETKKIWTKQLNKFLNDHFRKIILLVVIVVLVFGFFFLILPKYDQTTKYISAINKQEKFDFESKNTELSKIKDLLKAYSEIDQKYTEKVNAIAPFRKNKEELFSEINYLVSKNQIFLNSVSLGEVTSYNDSFLFMANNSGNAVNNIESVSISLSVEGTDYNAFKGFLAALEDNLRLMDVVSVNFNPVAKTTTLVINTYYTKQ